MPERLTESPFQELGEGKRWEYRGGDAPVDLVERPLRLTVLGIIMLAIAAELLWPTLMAIIMLLFFFMYGYYNPVFRDQALLTAVLLPVALMPATLQIIMGIGLFRQRSWSRTGSMAALLISWSLGTALLWSTEWLHKTNGENSRHATGAISGWLIHLLVLTPLVAGMILVLTRRETIEEFATPTENAS